MSNMQERETTQKIKLCYLAGPVRSMEDLGAGWRKDCGEALASLGISAFNPSSAFDRPIFVERAVAAQIEAVNRAAIDNSQAVIAMIDRRSLNIGTIREVEYARVKGLPVWVVSDEELDGKISVFDLDIVKSWQAAVADIRTINDQQARRERTERDKRLAGEGAERRADQDARVSDSEGRSGSYRVSAISVDGAVYRDRGQATGEGTYRNPTGGPSQNPS